MNVYPVTDSDLRTIGVMNFISAAFFSVGGIFLGLTANIWINAAFATNMPPEAKALVTYGVPACAGFAVLLFICGIVAIGFRHSIWKGVRQSVKPEAAE
jgi:hypothetical protein